ncbi:MAG TPA: YifB family Mg chelatase-like AAA ATPase [Acidimicrobiales bacterium]|nr:YifB family Mg chelatase-like AAA ATPase [Acidimicrobiales bacterium]
MLATVSSATLVGVEGRPIEVEVHVSRGLPAFSIVGLPDASCRESRDRVRAAVLSSGLSWPQHRVTVNLAPSSLRKGGAGLDLPIAVALLVADGQLPEQAVAGLGLLGELGLDGSIRRVSGVLPLVDAIKAERVVVPSSCAAEASMVRPGAVVAVPALRTLASVLRGEQGWPETCWSTPAAQADPGPDMADVRGQPMGRLAAEVSAAGGHHLLLVGPPGAGKTMLAERLPGLLPALTTEEALEVTRVHSAAGLPLPPGVLVRRPPFRAPHHSASLVSLIGGGTAMMRPGELSCAHNGVLFLDELGEFPADVLDTLRQPLEEGRVLVCRARASVVFPARVLLVAAMNPCPCGGDGGPGSCRCSDSALARYAARVSGPLLDRFDLRVRVDRPEVDELMGASFGATGADAASCATSGPEPSEPIARRVRAARETARRRGFSCNSAIPARDLDDVAPLTAAARKVLEKRLRQGRISARGLHRIRRVATTLADLAGQEGEVGEDHVLTALALRGPVFEHERVTA